MAFGSLLKAEEEQIGLIDGQTPDSKEEWWVYLALRKYGIRYRYQWQLFGARSRRGGMWVDFVDWNPRMTPLLVYGDYWHRSELKGGDKRRILAIASYFKIGWRNIPILWGSDAETKEKVDAWVG